MQKWLIDPLLASVALHFKAVDETGTEFRTADC
jgi:hypothetical protein